MNAVRTFNLDGTGDGLYTEAIDLSLLVAREIVRASRIELNHCSPQWEVRNAEGNLLFTDASRQTCLDWEHQYFNR